MLIRVVDFECHPKQGGYYWSCMHEAGEPSSIFTILFIRFYERAMHCGVYRGIIFCLVFCAPSS